MSTIRIIYSEEPKFPATDQHPEAERLELDVDGRHLWVDVLGGAPTEAEILAVLDA